MNIAAPPRGELPEWGSRIEFDHFFVELVPAGPRRMNIRLGNSFASISFDSDEGHSSLAGDRLRPYDRRPYEFIVTPPNFPLSGDSASAPEVLVFVFDFEAIRADVAAALQLEASKLEPRVIIGGPKTMTTELAQRIRRHIMAGDVTDDYLRSLCMVMLVDMIRLPKGQRNTGRGETLDNKVLASVLSYIDANLEGDLSLDALAQLSGVATHRFARSFKRKVGEPPHQYVVTRRIQAARSLLGSTDESIAEIAFATGFSSQSHMTTTLKKELGVTPGQLRSSREHDGGPGSTTG
jgi:AraC family transcriptional regulator